MVWRGMAWHRVARVVNRNERNEGITDHGKRAELSRAKTEEVELVADMTCISVRKQISDRASGHPCLPDT